MKTYSLALGIFRACRLWLLFLLIPQCVLSQTAPLDVTDEATRPKLGLCLSGGGAKGFAHIGVLKVLEEVGLRPEFITGTSMGSIVGGLYAIGYSADSLHAIISRQDWNQVLSDKVSLREVLYEEKPYFNNEIIELPFDDWNIKPPSGLIEGQQIMELLSDLTLPAYAINDFDSLPIPYQCIASDVVNGEFVILKDGLLKEAMRTSMAIPTVFTAIHQDSQVLVDGGFLKNFPVEEVVNMGAERVIGAYTGAIRKEKKELNSFTQILGQLAFLTSLDDAQKQDPYLDVYIEPDLSEFSAADFTSFDAIIEAGELAAREKYDELKALAEELNQYPAPKEPKKLLQVESIYIDEIYIRGNSQLSDEDIMGRAEIQPGDIVPVDDFKKIVEKLYGTNLFDIVKTSITKENGANVLYIDCKEKLTRTLSTALTYDSYTNAGFLFNANLRNVLLDSDRLMITAHITGQYRARFNYLKYLNRERTLMGEIDWQLHKDRLPILEGGVERQTYRFLSSQFSISLKRRFGQNGMFGLAMVNENYDFEPTQGRDLLFDGEIKISLFGFFGNVEFNSLNANVFPSRGTHITASVGVNTYNRIEILVENPIPPLQDSTSQFNNSLRVNFDMNSYFPVSDNGSIRVSPFLHAILNLKDNFSEYLMVGGPEKVSRYSVPFYGFDAHEIAVTAAAGGRLDYQQFLGDNLLLSAGLSGGLFGVPNSLFPTQDVRDYTFLGGMQMSVGYNTIVGPIRFYAMAPLETNDVTSSGWRTYLTFGYRF